MISDEIFPFFSILVPMATNYKSTASGAIYAQFSFYYVDKSFIVVLYSPFKWKDNNGVKNGQNPFHFSHSIIHTSTYGDG